jgi:hypothetical protein
MAVVSGHRCQKEGTGGIGGVVKPPGVVCVLQGGSGMALRKKPECLSALPPRGDDDRIR